VDDSVATALGYSHGLAYSIVNDHLKFRKVGARISEGSSKMSRMRPCNTSWYADDEEEMLIMIFTGEESWVHHYQPEPRCASVQRWQTFH
jgi:hypothetical protein